MECTQKRKETESVKSYHLQQLLSQLVPQHDAFDGHQQASLAHSWVHEVQLAVK